MTPLNRVAVLISTAGLSVALGASAMALTTSPSTAAATRPDASAAATCAPLDVACNLGGGSSPTASAAATTAAPTTAAPTTAAATSAAATCAPTDLVCNLGGGGTSPTPSATATTAAPTTAAPTTDAPTSAAATCAPLDVACNLGGGGTSPTPSATATTAAPTTAAPTSASATCAPLDVACNLGGGGTSPSPSTTPTATATATATASATPSPTASPTDSCPGDPTGITCIITGGGGSTPTPSATPSATRSATPSASASASATRSASPSPAKTTAASPSPSSSPVANPPVSHSVKFTPLGYRSIGSAVRVRTTTGYLTVLGHGGVPSTGVDQVLVFVQTAGSTTSSSLRTGNTVLAPIQKGITRHALDLVRLDTSGRIPVRVDKGSTLVSIKVVGYSGLTSTSAYQRIAAKKQVTSAPATLAAGRGKVLTLALPGGPSSGRNRWAAVVHLSIKPVGSTSTGTLSATVNGSTAFTGVSSYTAGTDSTVTVVVRPSSKGTVSFKLSKGSAIIQMTETAAWVPGASGTAFGTWPQGRVKAI